jgi:mannose-1-phosphate guanylyltransferase
MKISPQKNVAVIMAGGQGTRFWPYSTAEKPKQFLKVIGGESLITQTYQRLRHFIPHDNIFVVAEEGYYDLIRENIPRFSRDHLIAEPVPRNTAPCLILANIHLGEKVGEEANLIVVPADHYIPDTEVFARQMSAALRYADNKAIITSGIKPLSPHTGYGYIHFDPETRDSVENVDFHKVHGFTEKPDAEAAEGYCRDGGYFWNSGIFIYKLKHFRDMLQQYAPYYYKKYRELEEIYPGEKIEAVFRTITPQSIDYALMEKAREVRMFQAEYYWNDVGAWSSVYDLEKKDSRGNVNRGDRVVFQDSANSLVFTNLADKPVILIGVDRLAVIDTEKGLVVSDMGQLQKIKDALKKL